MRKVTDLSLIRLHPVLLTACIVFSHGCALNGAQPPDFEAPIDDAQVIQTDGSTPAADQDLLPDEMRDRGTQRDAEEMADVGVVEDPDQSPGDMAVINVDASLMDMGQPDGELLNDASVMDAEPEFNADNLLGDPGFEEDTGAWGIWGGAQRIENQGYTGEWALEATQTNGAEQRVEALRPNTTYRLSGWAQVQGEAPILIGVKDHGNTEKRLIFETPEYTYQSMTFTTGLASTSATIYVYKHGGGGAGYADDLTLHFEGPGALELSWGDEFDIDGRPDPEKWQHEEGFLRNEERQWYQPNNAFQEGGLLVIEGREERRRNPTFVAGSADWRTNREFIEYTSASLKTQGLFAFQYGRVSVRAKVSNETGTWPAIWTLGEACEWPSNGEVDIMENYGGQILANFAWGSDLRWQAVWDAERRNVADLGADWTERFHVWELDWNENRMLIFLDGKLLNRVNLSDTTNGSAACEGDNPFQQRHYLLLNLALGGNGGRLDDLNFPTRYLVDYIRVYQ